MTKLALVVLSLAFVGPARAESAKVELPYRTTAHFAFYGDDAVAPLLDKLAGVAEVRFAAMCKPIAACDRVKGTIDIWVAEDAERFAAGFPEPSPMSEWAAGVTFLDQQRVILRAHGSAMLTVMETFDHELAHVLAHTYDTGSGRHLPRWFHEGLAIWLAGESVLERLDSALRAASSGRLLTYDELTERFPNDGVRVEIAYAQSAFLMKRMVREGGAAAVIGILHDAGQGVAFDASFAKRLGTTPLELFNKLGEDLDATSSPFIGWQDGNYIFVLITVLFLGVAWSRLRDRKRQMARLADNEDERIAAEDLALLAERTRAHPIDPAPPLDEDGKPLLH